MIGVLMNTVLLNAAGLAVYVAVPKKSIWRTGPTGASGLPRRITVPPGPGIAASFHAVTHGLHDGYQLVACAGGIQPLVCCHSRAPVSGLRPSTRKPPVAPVFTVTISVPPGVISGEP